MSASSAQAESLEREKELIATLNRYCELLSPISKEIDVADTTEKAHSAVLRFTDAIDWSEDEKAARSQRDRVARILAALESITRLLGAHGGGFSNE